MEVDTKELGMIKIKDMGSEFLFTEMGVFIKVHFRMESDQDQDDIYIQMALIMRVTFLKMRQAEEGNWLPWEGLFTKEISKITLITGLGRRLSL